MTRVFFGAIGVAALAGTALADVQVNDFTLFNSTEIGTGWSDNTRADANATYSNIDTFTGFAAPNGGAALQGANTITRLLADDISQISANTNVNKITWYVANLNGVAVSARMRMRFYAADGAGGGPGTLLTGFTFNAVSLPAGSVSGFFFNPGGISLPKNLWYGMTFDNNNGATGATLAQMNGLGLGIFDPPAIGSSADKDFLTTAAGSHFVANPAGTIRNSPFGGAPKANYGLEIVPAPGALTLLGLGGLLVSRRRR